MTHFTDLPARNAYFAFIAGSTALPDGVLQEAEKCWEELPEEEKNMWRRIATAAVRAHPAPVSGEISIRLPGPPGVMPVAHEVRCDVTKESIRKEMGRLADWLIHLTEVYRP